MSRVKSFDGVFEMPVPGRTVKPRKEGLTMIIDKGLGLSGTQDLLDSAADYIDFIKLTFGTSAFLDIDYTAEKVEMVKDYDLDLPRRNFLEVSVWQHAYRSLKRCRAGVSMPSGVGRDHRDRHEDRADCISAPWT
jgi:phosphosulfolactate synthase